MIVLQKYKYWLVQALGSENIIIINYANYRLRLHYFYSFANKQILD